MSRKKNIQKMKSNLFWRVAISLVGAALVLIAVFQLMLFFLGETAAADISVRRVGGANDNALVSQRYEWSVDYTFKDQDGRIHSGHTTRRGSDTSAGVADDTVYYFPFAPFVNALERDAGPGLHQLVFVVLGVFLLIVMNKKKGKALPQNDKHNIQAPSDEGA